MDMEDLFIKIIIVLVVIFLVWTGYATIGAEQARIGCLEQGWPHSGREGGNIWCMIIEDGTEIVRPLANILMEK